MESDFAKLITRRHGPLLMGYDAPASRFWVRLDEENSIVYFASSVLEALVALDVGVDLDRDV